MNVITLYMQKKKSMRKVVDIASIIALNSLSTTIWKMALFFSRCTFYLRDESARFIFERVAFLRFLSVG